MTLRLVELYSVIKEIAITSGFDTRPEIRLDYCAQHFKLPRPTDFGGTITTGLVFNYNFRFGNPRPLSDSGGKITPLQKFWWSYLKNCGLGLVLNMANFSKIDDVIMTS